MTDKKIIQYEIPAKEVIKEFKGRVLQFFVNCCFIEDEKGRIGVRMYDAHMLERLMSKKLRKEFKQVNKLIEL